MKKLMIVAAMVCAAAMSYGAAANWSGGASEIMDGTDSTAYYAGTAYLFDAGQMSQQSLFDLFASGATIGSGTAGYMTQGTVNNGSLSFSFQNGEQGDGKTYSYYFALLEEEMIYLSNYKGGEPNTTSSPKSVQFGDQYDWSGCDPSITSDSNALPTEGYQQAGRWAAVPEPFSGTLALLGMGVVALRRKMKKAKKA